jgi:hypothetical protein
MRNILIAGLTLAALAAVPAAAEPAPALLLSGPSAAPLEALAASAQQGVQVWMDGYRDVYRPGERMSVRVRTQRDGYLAVFHIDTNGDVDIIYPRSEGDDGWVEGGRTMRLGSRGAGYDYLRVNGGYGMGYVMAVMLDEPLELWRVRDFYQPRNAGWDANRTVYGDPFYAMDEIVRTVVPEEWSGYESVDHTTYHVGQRYRYPRYACYDGYGDWYNYRGVYWDDCDRVRVVLVNYPYYYDAWRWRHPRRAYYERYYYRTATVQHRPLHGYKERTDSYAPPARSASQRRPSPSRSGGSAGSAGAPDRSRRPGSTADRPGPVGGRSGDASGGSARPGPRSGGSAVRGGGDAGRVASPRSGAADRPTPRGPAARPVDQDDAEPRQQDRPVRPSRERPTFQRRPAQDGGSTRSAEPRRESPPPERSAEPRRETPPQRSAEPRRESPPERSAEPRREAPPQRSAEPRREAPPQRSAEPRRESPPQRSAQPSRPRGNSGGSRSSTPSRSPSRRP